MDDGGDRMFCHACGGVWLRDEHGLSCPHCESEFTEIVRTESDGHYLLERHSNRAVASQIEIPPDIPPESPESLPSLESPPHINPWAEHNPWAREDPPEPRERNFYGGTPRFSHHTYRSPDGRFTFSSTTIGGGYSPRQARGQNPFVPMMIQALDTMFQGLQETYDNQRTRAVSENPFHPDGWPEHDHPAEEHPDPPELFPRDADGPQPMPPPVGLVEYVFELMYANQADGNSSLLEALRTARGGGMGGARVNPFAILAPLLRMDQNGDAVYTQEEFDRIISQLIDQNTNGTAPPPASDSAIRSLPKKEVDKQMMGTDGKAECSICMEAVEVGTEVTVLPCTHWFHFPCIEAWLREHNTCPHCRQGINSAGE